MNGFPAARANALPVTRPTITPPISPGPAAGKPFIAVNGVGEYTRIGTTVDDAVGEAFDKVAKLLGLAYPGGPQVEIEALKGDPGRFDLPRPMLARQKPDFSLSGLKTAVRLQAERAAPLSAADVSDLCASFQGAIVDVIVDRVRMGLRVFRTDFGHPSALVVAGGVAANQAIRRALVRFCGESGLRLVTPPPNLCTDNGAMIAWTGIERLRLGLVDGLDFPARPQRRERWDGRNPCGRPAAPFALGRR